jgi:hypothetical protein
MLGRGEWDIRYYYDVHPSEWLQLSSFSWKVLLEISLMHLDKQLTPNAFGQHLKLVNNANAPTFRLTRNFLTVRSLRHYPTLKKLPYYFYV